MFGFKSLLSVTFDLRNMFAGQESDAMQFVILSYNKRYDALRTFYFSNLKLVTPLGKDELILVCYYAPNGNWDKYYGDSYCWRLTCRQIALDIINNTLLYNNNFAVDGRDILPSWLRNEVDSHF